jgi:hypothetical protein
VLLPASSVLSCSRGNPVQKIADFILYMGSMDDQKLWNILLGKVLSSLDQLISNSRPAMRPRSTPAAVQLSSATRYNTVSPSLSGPVLYYPAYLQ